MKRAGVFVVAAFVVAGCSNGGGAATNIGRPTETVPLGQLPDPPTQVELPPPPTAPPETTVPAEPEVQPIDGPVGAAVLGNRLLLIGDTAMATLTERQQAAACPALPDLGWDVQIEAEVARYLRFADVVIDRLVVDAGDDWDAYGLMFGHQIDTGAEEFGAGLDGVLARLGGRPVLLYTIAEGRAADDGDAEDGTADDVALAAALNDQIRARGRSMPNVVVVDWAQAIDESDDELVDDERVPTAAGAAALVELTAAALGGAPVTTGGTCLEPVFTDDSAIVI